MPDKTDQEKQILLDKTEDAMLDGFDKTSEIAEIIEVDVRTAANYMKLIQDKWVRSSEVDIEEKRKELIRKLGKTEKDLSIIASAALQDTAKVGALNAKLRAFERQAKLLGLEIDTIRHEKPKDRMSPESFDTIEKQLKEREKPDVPPKPASTPPPPVPPKPPPAPVKPPPTPLPPPAPPVVPNVNPTANPPATQ